MSAARHAWTRRLAASLAVLAMMVVGRAEAEGVNILTNGNFECGTKIVDNSGSYGGLGTKNVTDGWQGSCTLMTTAKNAWHNYVYDSKTYGTYMAGMQNNKAVSNSFDVVTPGDYAIKLAYAPRTTYGTRGQTFSVWVDNMMVTSTVVSASTEAMMNLVVTTSVYNAGKHWLVLKNAMSSGATDQTTFFDNVTVELSRPYRGLDIATTDSRIVGNANPSYGFYETISDETVCTVDAAWTNAEQTICGDCKGWKLYDGDGNELDRGDGRTFTYSKSDAYRRLVWQWEVSYRVTATADAGGTVGPAEQWIKAGEPATVVATADAGYKFLMWKGDGCGLTRSITVSAVTEPLSLAAHFCDADAKVVYVATNGVDSAESGTAAVPYKTVNVAFDALSATLGAATGIVAVAEGKFCLTNTLWLTNAVRVIGAGMYRTSLSGLYIRGTNSVWAGLKGVSVKNAAAGMSDLTVTECSSKDLIGAGIYMSKGTLSGVRSYANSSGLGEYLRPSRGSGLYMDGGLATNCVIEANTGNGGYGDRIGTGLCMASGTFTDGQILNNVCNRSQVSGVGVAIIGSGVVVRNTLISGNTSKQTNPDSCSHGIGVYMTANGTVENCRIVNNGVQAVYLSSGTMRNCLVTGSKNESTGYTAGVQVSGGAKVQHCTIWGNTAANKFSGLYCDNANAKIVNNIVYGNGTDGSIKVTAGVCQTNVVDTLAQISTSMATGNVANDPLFADPSNGDFSFDNGSPAFDTAATIAGIDRDLNGVARPKNSAPDIGCFECEVVFAALEVKINVSKTDWTVGEVPSAEARVFGGSGTITYKWYVDGVLDEDADTATPSFPGLSTGKHTISVTVSDGTNEASDTKTDAFAVKPCEVYVDDATGNDADNYPYDDAAKPAKTVNAAFDALGRAASNTCTVHIASGTYSLTKELTLDTTCRLYGSGRETTILDGAKLASTARGISMSAKNCIVKCLTVRNCKTLMTGTGIYLTGSNGWVEDVAIRNNESGMGNGSKAPAAGAGLCQSAGTVTNCVISGNSHNGSYGNSDGAGVYISGGTIVDSVITNNWRNRNQIRGAGVRVSGSAKLLRCKIVGNSNKQGTFDSLTDGMGVYMDGGTVEDCEIVGNGRQNAYVGGGTMRQCLVAGAKTAPSGWAGGLHQTGGTVLNCTVGGNKSATAAYHDLLMTNGKFQNSIAEYAQVTGGTVTYSVTNESARFHSVARGDYAVFPSSPAVEAGDWSLLGKTLDAVKAMKDLSGAPRFVGDAVDCGCYENPLKGLMLIVK